MLRDPSYQYQDIFAQLDLNSRLMTIRTLKLIDYDIGCFPVQCFQNVDISSIRMLELVNCFNFPRFWSILKSSTSRLAIAELKIQLFTCLEPIMAEIVHFLRSFDTLVELQIRQAFHGALMWIA